MDAVEFLKAAEKRSLSDPDYYGEFINLCGNDFVALVAQVEQWAKEHPIKTRQSEFLKMFQNAKINEGNGIISISPCALDSKLQYGDGCIGRSCIDCRRDYWLQEVE